MFAYKMTISGPAIALLILTVTAQGCGGEESGSGVCEKVKCPVGYTCREKNGKAQCLGPDAGGDLGIKKDIGPKQDQTGPKKDKTGPKKDKTGPKKDQGKPSDLVATPDLPVPDMPGAGAPQVTLISPADKSSTASIRVVFLFHVSSTSKTKLCELFMDGKKEATLVNPGPKPSFALTTVKDGKHSWSIKCQDIKGLWGGSPVRSFTLAPLPLTACKSGGFVARTRYRLSSNITGGTGDCFVVDANGVVLEGNGKTITSTRYKDLLVHRGKNMAAAVYRNNGPTGAWTKTWTSTYKDDVGDRPSAADFTGDGMLDLVLPSVGGNLRVFNNSGNGTFSSKPAYSSKNKNFTSPRTADLNQDGHVDLVLAGNGAKEELLLNKGLAGLTLTASYDWGNLTRDLDLIDFNGDAVLDLVAGSGIFGTVSDQRRVVKGNISASGFGYANSWFGGSNARGAGAAFVADINSDGDMDLLLPSVWLNNRTARVFSGNGAGGFKLTTNYLGTIPAAARDMNGDGTTDLVLLQASAYNLPTSIQIRLLNSKGGSLKTITVQVSGGIASWLVRDLDGDSQPEVVVTSGSKSSKLTVYHNQLKSPGIMKATYTYSLKGSLKILDARDLDNDGPLDLIVSSSGTLHSLLVHSQGAGLAFKAKTLLMGGGGSAFFGASLGDLTAPPARGIHIKKGAFDVTISGVSAIRGYSTGILVEGNKAVLSEVTVEDTDLHGVRFSGVASGKVSSLTTRNLFQGVGLALDNATIVTVNNSDLCDAGYNPRLTAVGARCIKSAANGANNRLRLNNGCTTMATKPCP